MTRPVQTSVNVRFNSDVGSASPIILEQSSEWTGQSGFGSIAVREFPRQNGVTRNASVGQVIDTGIVRQLTRNEFIQFNGDSSSVRYPIDNASTSVNVVFSFNPDGSTLSPSQLSFVLTPGSSQIRANRPFIGAIQVQYYSSYRVLSYTADGYTGSTTTNTLSGDDLFRRFGTIISVKDTQSAILEIQSDQNDGSLRKELYRVQSIVQVNEAGAWEKSPDFDTGGGWNDNSAPRDGDSIFEYNRPHEIGYLNRVAEGRIEFETVTVFTERGPSGNFYADLSVRFHGEGSFIDTPWEDSYSRVDLNQIRADVTQRFNNHTVTF